MQDKLAEELKKLAGKTVARWKKEMKHWSQKDIRKAAKADCGEGAKKKNQDFAIAARAMLEKRKATMEKKAMGYSERKREAGPLKRLTLAGGALVGGTAGGILAEKLKDAAVLNKVSPKILKGLGFLGGAVAAAVPLSKLLGMDKKRGGRSE